MPCDLHMLQQHPAILKIITRGFKTVTEENGVKVYCSISVDFMKLSHKLVWYSQSHSDKFASHIARCTYCKLSIPYIELSGV